MLRVLLLLLAVAGLHARPLHQFPNDRLKPIWPDKAQHEDRDNMNTGVKPKKQTAVPVELRRQGTEPSRRFLMDLNTGMLKKEISEMNRRVSGFYNPPAYGKRQGTEPSRRFLMDLNTGMPLHEVGEMNRRVSGFYNPPAYEMRKGTQNSRATLVNPRTGQKLPQLSELQRRTAPLDDFRQDHVQHMMKPHELRAIPAEPSRNVLMDLNTGLLKEHRNELDGRVAGSAKWEVVSGYEHEDIKSQDSSERKENRVAVPVELQSLSELQRRTAPLDEFRQATEHQPQVLHELKQGSEPSGDLKMDVNTGLLKENQHKMSRRSRSVEWEVVSGYEHEDIKSQDSSERKENRVAVPVELRRQGTEPSRRFLMDFNTGMLKKEVSEMNRRVSGFYNPPAYGKRQGTEPSRRFLMDLNTGMPLHEVGEMNRRVSGFYNPPAYEMRKGTQNSRATLVNPRTGQKLPSLSELQRRTAPLDEFRQATEHQPQVLHELKHGSEPSGNLKMDVNTGLLKENQHKMSRRSRSVEWEVVSGYEHEDIKSQDSSERKENRVAVPVELRRQGTEPSRRFLMDLNTGMLKKEVSEMNRRVSGFYNPPAYGKRQGTEPSRRFLMDLNTGMPLHEVGEMNRRVSGFYNPPAYEMRKGTQNSRATLVNPRTGQKLPSLSELQRRTAPYGSV